MKNSVIIPVCAAALLAAACSEPTAVDTRAHVRFVNATQDMTGNGGFTKNGQFAAGSAVAPGQATQTCAAVAAGATSFGFGAANAGGTALSGGALGTLSGQNILANGNYTLAAAGPATNPQLFLLDNSVGGSLGANQAAVRFVNLAPGTGTTPWAYVAYLGAVGTTAPVAFDLAAGAPSAFASVTSGVNTFGILQIPGHNIVVPSIQFTLPAGSANTMAIVPTASGSVELIHLQGCS